MLRIAMYAAALLITVVVVWLSIVWDDYFGDPKKQEGPEQAPASSSSARGKVKIDPRSQALKDLDKSFQDLNSKGYGSRGKDGLPVGNFESSEVLVANPPKGFENAVKAMGFGIIEKMTLDGLGMEVLRLRVPQGLTVRTAVKTLREKFPGVNIDANHQFDPSQAADKEAAKEAAKETGKATETKVAEKEPLLSYPRAAAGWKNVDPTCGRELLIGVIDGVVQTRHPAIKGQKVQFRTYHREDRRAGPSDHGTAIVAMLVGKSSEQGWGGILPGARVLAANMFEYNAQGRLVGSSGALIKAINWMLESQVNVINMSLAGEDNRILRSVIDKVREKGVVMVAAAGNWGRADRPAYPAAYPSVIAVTAFGDGHKVYDMANRGAYIDFAAPGVKMWTAVPGGGRYQSGSSFATPYVTALTADVVKKQKLKSAGQVIDALKGHAVDLGVAGKDSTYGWGFIAREPACR